jgi:predicted transcriptional regulator
MEKLTIQEEELMQVIWQFGEGSVKTFLQEMPDPKPPYTTLASTIKNLEKKGFVKSYLSGNTYIYTPVVTHESTSTYSCKASFKAISIILIKKW